MHFLEKLRFFENLKKVENQTFRQTKSGFHGLTTMKSTSWQGHKDLNPEPTVLETAALPIELYPYIEKGKALSKLVGLQGLEPGTIRL